MLPFEYLGPYKVVEPIGRGGMGSVYRAVHSKSGETVAVKVIATAMSDEPRFRRRFDDEIKTLIKLRHPNIVSVIGRGEQQGLMFYSMELVEGESLQQRLRREKKLLWPTVLEMSIDICNALKHAHNFGVYHRDLKPANLLIATDGTVKLVDFGIAKIFGSSDQTAAGSVLGTADFMSPEQACGGGITGRTDLYALGNVMYACFAGRSPFAGRTLPQAIDALAREMPTPLNVVAADVPKEIVQLVHHLLEKLPEDRPPTALAVMNRMKAIRAGLHRQEETREVIPADEKTVHRKPASSFGTRSEATADGEQPTVFAEERLELRTTVPKNDLTVQAGTSATPRTPSTHRDQDYALTGESLKRVEPKPLPMKPGSSGNNPTIASQSESGPHSLAHETQPTHFSTVQESERTRGLLVDRVTEAEPSRWLHWLSIASLFGLLAAGAGVFLWSLQRPTADALFKQATLAQTEGNADRFRDLSDQFQRLYPNDRRNDDLSATILEDDTASLLRRLRLASLRVGGDEWLEPAEQIFCKRCASAITTQRKQKFV